MGGAPPEKMSLRFDVLILAAMEYQPPPNAFPNVQVVYVPLDDAKISLNDIKRAQRAGRIVSDAVRRNKRVLVTCYMGRNRSGLITAFALKDLGYSTDDAIRRIQAIRGKNALSNSYFVHALHNS